MTKRIVLIGARLSTNFGGPSLLVSVKMALDTVLSNAEYTLLVSANEYKSDKILAPRYNIEVKPFTMKKWSFPLALLRRWIGVLIGPESIKDTIKVVEDADLIIDIWGIIFADSIGSNTFLGRLFEGLRFVFFKIIGKPVIKYTADLGPFNNKWNRFFAKLYLGHFVDLILARDETSFQSLKELGVKTKILTVPDTAFLLPFQESHESKHYIEIRKKNTLIGVSVSFQAKNRTAKNNDYISIMKDFIKYLIMKHEAYVVIIPNELSSNLYDDLKIAEEISSKVNNTNCEILYTDNLLAQEIKGVINQCEVFVASRYHSIVAALSLGIPTLAIGWHHKYMGVLKPFKQEKWLCDIKVLKLDDLVNKFDNLWKNRGSINKTLIELLPGIREGILLGAKELQKIK